MMRKSNIEFFVGLFALAGFAVIIYMSLTINRAGVVGSGHKYKAFFSTVSGLEAQTPVELAGIDVGFVSNIDLAKDQAMITVTLRKDVILHHDAVLRIKDKGILGDKILVVEAGNPDGPVLKPGGTIERTIGKSDFDRLVNTMADASLDIKEISGAIKDFVSNENEDENMRGMLRNFKQVSDSLVRTTEIVERLARQNEDKIGSLVEDMRSISQTVRDAVENEDTGVKESLKKVNDAMAHLSSVMEKIDKGEGTLGKLVNDEETVEKVNQAVEGVNEFMGGLRRIQTSFLYRGEYLFDSDSLQNLVGIYIQTRPDKFFLIEMVDAPRGETTVTDTIVSSPPGTVIAQTQTVRTGDSLLFSAQFGKRFYDFSFRFGLIRNKGGLGLDYQFLNDIFKISIEAFDFGRYDNRPHMRLYGQIQVYKNFLFAVGADDLIEKDGRRDFFVGAGVYFTDNDFKSLFGAVSVP